MELTLKEQIERINALDKSEKALILIKAIESFLNISTAVNIVLNKYTSKNKDNHHYIKSIGLDIVDEFRNHDNYIFFEKELKKFCGFHEEDEVSSNTIFECCSEGKVDILNLKKRLIDAAVFLHDNG